MIKMATALSWDYIPRFVYILESKEGKRYLVRTPSDKTEEKTTHYSLRTARNSQELSEDVGREERRKTDYLLFACFDVNERNFEDIFRICLETINGSERINLGNLTHQIKEIQKIKRK